MFLISIISSRVGWCSKHFGFSWLKPVFLPCWNPQVTTRIPSGFPCHHGHLAKYEVSCPLCSEGPGWDISGAIGRWGLLNWELIFSLSLNPVSFTYRHTICIPIFTDIFFSNPGKYVQRICCHVRSRRKSHSPYYARGSAFSFIQKSWFIFMWFQVLNGL